VTELRQDRTTGAWVIIAPGRKLRPKLVSDAASGSGPAPAFDPRCPFCPGNEMQLPGIIAETPAPTPPGWRVRVVPNKYPALAADAPPGPLIRSPHVALGGYGAHEVVIEHPRHNADPAAMDDAELQAMVQAYRQRYIALADRPGIETVVLFRNRGAASGASLSHPHTQLIALGLATPKVRALADWGRHHYDADGRCPTCAEVELETESGARVVEETSDFVALVPFAAERPSELWLIPKRHQPSFADATERELQDFGRLLRQSLRRLQAVHGALAYNFVVDSANTTDRGAPYLHWRLRIMPNLVTWGGFELGTGIVINPSSPELDARTLRDAEAEPTVIREAAPR
jgi:UDPglucose--hexose-1-phosphate uridylyltransferase